MYRISVGMESKFNLFRHSGFTGPGMKIGLSSAYSASIIGSIKNGVRHQTQASAGPIAFNEFPQN